MSKECGCSDQPSIQLDEDWCIPLPDEYAMIPAGVVPRGAAILFRPGDGKALLSRKAYIRKWKLDPAYDWYIRRKHRPIPEQFKDLKRFL